MQRNNQHQSPLPPDPQGDEDIIQPDPGQHRHDGADQVEPEPRDGEISPRTAGHTPEGPGGEAPS